MGQRMLVRLFCIAFLFLQGCAVFVPAEAFEQHESETCQLLTKSLTLEAKVLSGQVPAVQCQSAACLIVPLVLPVGSLIVSGSIVLTNNTLHWVEYQGRCNLDWFSDGVSQPIKDVQDCTLQCDEITGQCQCII